MKKNKQLLIILISILTLFSSSLYAQENIILRTDRNLYIAGEPIWISLLCLKNGTNKPSKISKVGYVELLNKENTPVLQSKIHLDEGSANTRIFIPNSVKTGNYRLRCYTQLLRNYNKDYYYTQNISIINPFTTDRFPKFEHPLRGDTLLFFPEGGNLIQDAENNILVHLLNKYGKGIKTTVYITIEKDTLKQFNTNSAGFGKFKLTPKEHGNYELKYNVDGLESLYSLPNAKELNTLLSLSDVDEKKIEFIIKRTSSRGVNDYGDVHIATSHGDFVKSLNVKNNNRITLDRKQLPEGFLCAYLIDSKGEVISSRYFIAQNSNRNIQPQLTLNKKTFGKREKVSLNITQTQHLKERIVSVTKTCLYQKTNWINQPNNLNSFSYKKLKRYTDNTINLNDLLLCFVPNKDIWHSTPQLSYLPEIEGERISGKITNKKNLKHVSNEKLMLSFVGDPATLDITTTDSLGRFNFSTNKYGLQELVIQPLSNDTNKLSYNIDLDNNYSTLYPEFNIPEFSLRKQEILEINQAIVNMQINTLYSTNGTSPLDKKEGLDTLSFYGVPEYYIPIDKYIELVSTAEIIKEIVPLTSVHKRKGKQFIKIIEPPSMYKTEGESFVMVDGVPIKDIDRVLNIPAEDLKRIELTNLNYFLDGIELGRILSFFTNKGDLSSLDFDERIFRQLQECYALPYDFSDPSYDLNNNTRSPDFRNVLFWESADSNSIEFFTSDESSNYTVIVEGINTFGKIEKYETVFSVVE